MEIGNTVLQFKRIVLLTEIDNLLLEGFCCHWTMTALEEESVL